MVPDKNISQGCIQGYIQWIQCIQGWLGPVYIKLHKELYEKKIAAFFHSTESTPEQVR